MLVVNNPPTVIAPPKPPPTLSNAIVPEPAFINVSSFMVITSDPAPLLRLSALASTWIMPAPDAVMSPAAANVILSSAASVIAPSTVVTAAFTVRS